MKSLDKFIIFVALAAIGLSAFVYYAFTTHYDYSLRLTHNSQPVKAVAVSLCYKYCTPNTVDFQQAATDADGRVSLREGFWNEPSNHVFEFTYNGTGYEVSAIQGQLVDDPI